MCQVRTGGVSPVLILLLSCLVWVVLLMSVIVLVCDGLHVYSCPSIATPMLLYVPMWCLDPWCVFASYTGLVTLYTVGVAIRETELHVLLQMTYTFWCGCCNADLAVAVVVSGWGLSSPGPDHYHVLLGVILLGFRGS